MGAQDAEEVGRRRDLAVLLIEIILKEGEESLIADAGSQVVEEMSAFEINRIGVWPEAAAIIDRNIHPAFWIILIAPHIPP